MHAWIGDLERQARKNEMDRAALFSGAQTQLTVISISPGDDTGWAMHPEHDRFLRIEEGQARVELGATQEIVDETFFAGKGWAVVVPAGTWHTLANAGPRELKLSSVAAEPAAS